MASRAWLVALAFAASLLLCAWTHGAAPTADPLANQTTINEQIYLSLIGQRTAHRVVVGQYIGGVACCDAGGSQNWTAQFPVVWTGLVTATGKAPGFIGADYLEFNSASPGTPISYTALNNQLIAEWNAGSLVQISYGGDNPWTGNYEFDIGCGGPIATASIASSGVMTVTAVSNGALAPGMKVNQASGGATIPTATTILSQIDGTTGGNGHYQLSASGYTVGSQTINASITTHTLADLANPSTTDLTNSGISVYTQWHNQLAAVAVGLQQLQAAGVTVIFRPIYESNGNGFWSGAGVISGACNTSNTAAEYTAVWRDMFTTLTQTYGLHNLLWTYATLNERTFTNDVLFFYPGAAYTDIVGVDNYQDATTPVPTVYSQWARLIGTGKIVVYPERGATQAAIAISSGTYNSGTGAVSLTLSSSPATSTYFATSGVSLSSLAGTGSGLSSLNGDWTATAGTTGTTINFTGPTGLGAVTISGGNAGGPLFETLMSNSVVNSWSPSLPMASYMQAWFNGSAIVNNAGASAYMNDANAANQGDVGPTLACMAGASYARKTTCALGSALQLSNGSSFLTLANGTSLLCLSGKQCQ